MRSILTSSVLFLFSFCLNAQNEEAILLGKKEIIASKVLNENRKIWVYSPDNTSQSTNAGKRYPVLYLLDGDAHFFSTVGIVQQLSQANGNGVLPEMIVVAIENTNRLRDLVPPEDLTKTNPFVEFLSTELMPYIDKNYNTAPYKLLVGHSLGGLTVIDILAKSPELFNAYIAIDPSVWYDNEKFLNHTIAQFPRLNMKGKRLFIGMANTMPVGMNISKLKNDRSKETQHMRSIIKFGNYLKTNTNGLLYAQNYYEKERHNTVPMLCEYDGLRYIFDYYYLDATEKDFTDSTARIASLLKRHYAEVSKEMGYENAVPEAFINYLAYDALGRKHYKKSKALFELNMEWYPERSSVYDAYADYFLDQKDTIQAILNYKKSLQIKTNELTQKKLDALISKATAASATAGLQKYEGTYTLEAFQLDITLKLRDGSLWAIVPGQADDEFQLISDGIFTVKGKQGYTITFQMNGDKPKGFTSVQPNGTFKAVFKHH